jgi:Icc-related predicted phosphoesterase
MTILHVTDFHFNKHWFNWLLHHAPAHDLVVMSGDLLDLAAATPHRRQIAWVSDWLNDFPRALCVCSGNHDLEWDSEAERWTPAYWLRDLTNPKVWADGQRVELNGVSLLNIGVTTKPKGGEADIWVVHAAPSDSLVATRANGAAGGDPDLVAPARRHAPRLVLSGHVHSPLSWRERRNSTLFLNPGRSADSPFPNHILVRTDRMTSQLVTAGGTAHESTVHSPGVPSNEDVLTTTAVI